MTQETYRFAYEEATSELRDIAGQFEALCVRKTQVEQVIEALRALMNEGQPAESVLDRQIGAEPSAPFVDPTPFLVQTSVEAMATPEPMGEPEPEPVYAEQSSDPFQRRIDNALKHGFGAAGIRG